MQAEDDGSAGPEQSRSALVLVQRAMPLEAECALIVIRATGVDSNLAYGKQHINTGFAVTRFEIEDALVARRCVAHCVLARSFEAAPQAVRSLPCAPAMHL